MIGTFPLTAFSTLQCVCAIHANPGVSMRELNSTHTYPHTKPLHHSKCVCVFFFFLFYFVFFKRFIPQWTEIRRENCKKINRIASWMKIPLRHRPSMVFPPEAITKANARFYLSPQPTSPGVIGKEWLSKGLGIFFVVDSVSAALPLGCSKSIDR